MTRIRDNEFRDEQLFNEVMWGLQEVRETFQKIINRFQTLVYCLNKCGQLLQLLTDCKTCKTDIHTCSKDVHCGVTPLGNNSVLPTVAPLRGPLTVPPTPWVPGALAHWTVWIVISSSTGLILLLLAGCFCFYHRQERAVKDDDDVESRLLRA
ncbi:izumo sperm-egg fusion protein 1 [Alligator mississippiensis]|uniref:Izumo sperm-egg fusion protein 1 n=1 Tax=Alligator mississippiensis TaxID=8496 RepID=A0A151MGL1_ALLMI|nr:izumo sperm-egg fusion protein 1 [Alligator mississippiensis]